MVRLLLFAYCEGVRSSRQIERRCVRDVAIGCWRGIGVPTMPRLLGSVIGIRWRCGRCLCRCCGCARRPAWCGSGCWRWTAPSCRRMLSFQNYDVERLEKVIGQLDEQVAQMLAEAAGQDAAEDAAEQDRSDSGGPPELRNRTQRLAKLKAAKQRLDAEAAEAQRIQDQRRADWEQARGPKGAPPGVRPPKRGSRNGKINLTDPDSRIMHTRDGFRQAFNGQAVVLATRSSWPRRWCRRTPIWMRSSHVGRGPRQLDAAGVADPIRAVVADAGYSNKQNRPGLPRRAIARSCWWRCGQKPAEGRVRKIYPSRGRTPHEQG